MLSDDPSSAPRGNNTLSDDTIPISSQASSSSSLNDDQPIPGTGSDIDIAAHVREGLQSFGSEPSSSSSTLPKQDSNASLRSQISTHRAKLGNEFSSSQIRHHLQTLFTGDLVEASRVIIQKEFSGTFYAVWTALAWDLNQLIKEMPKPIPFTTIATALDILRRSIRYERLQSDATRDDAGVSVSSEAAAAIADSDYVRRLPSMTRVVWLHASFLLAAKVEETLISFTTLKRILAAKYTEQHQRLVDGIVMKEQRILAILGFDIVVHIPHIKLLKIADQSIYLKCPDYLKDLAIRFLNISIFTSVMSVYNPVSIAITALYHAVQNRQSHFDPSDPFVSRPWWEDFQVPMEEIVEISIQLVPCINALLKLSPPLVVPQASQPSSSSLACLERRTIVPCRRRDEFKKQKLINKGTFGTVWSVTDLKDPNSPVVALKMLHSTYAAHGGFPYYMLREILYLIRLNHPNIIHGIAMAVKEVPDSPPIFFIVMEYVEWDLLRLLQYQIKLEETALGSHKFTLAQVKSILHQLLTAIDYMHSMHLLHRDLKCANLLLNREGILKVADLGSIRDADRQSLNMTVQVITLWYRPPELLWESPSYTTSVDIWSIGCLFYELLTYKPLFAGKTEMDQLAKIIRGKGKPPADVWEKCFENLPHTDDPLVVKSMRQYPSPRPVTRLVDMYLSDFSAEGKDLFSRMLEWDPAARITAREALSHPFFSQEPLPQPAIPPPPPSE